MSTGLHRDLAVGEIHTVVAYVYADATARLAATGFTSADLYKFAYQVSTGTLWVLQDDSPITWSELASGSSPQLNKVEISCRKGTSGTLVVGTVVYVSDYNTGFDHAEVEAAKADSQSTLPVVGVINVQCTDSVTGKLLVLGVLHDLDTSGLTAGSPIYISHTVAGAIVDSPPPGPYVVQPIGVCLNSHATLGHIGVNVLSYRAIDYTNDPENLGVAAHGTKNEASPSDHVHLLPKLDDLNTPDDNTDLDASTGQHGLLKKLGGGTTNFLRADGSWAAPSGGGQTNTVGGATGITNTGDNVDAVLAPTYGSSANTVCEGDDSRLSDDRTPTTHASTHNSGGADVMAIDAAAGTGSLRTLGTAATAACAGNDSRLSDDRDPNDHATTHESGGGDPIQLDDLAAPSDNTDLDATTSLHGLLKKLGGGTTNYLRADGTWAEPPGSSASVFGNGYQSAASTGSSDTTSTSFQDKVTLTTPALAAGTYRVGWVALMRHSSASTRFEVQCANITDGGTIGGIGEQEPKDNNNDIHVGSFEEVTFTGVAKVFKIQYRSQSANTTYISEARIEIWRVS